VTEIVGRETNWVPLHAVEQRGLSEARLQAQGRAIGVTKISAFDQVLA